MKPQKLTISLQGRHYDITLSDVSDRVFKEIAWLSQGNVDSKTLLKAYLQKCQEFASMEEELESICKKID